MKRKGIISLRAFSYTSMLVAVLALAEAHAAPPVLHGDAAKASILEALMVFRALDRRKDQERATRAHDTHPAYAPERLMGVAIANAEMLETSNKPRSQ